MKADIAKLWSAALRAGGYQQGRYNLHAVCDGVHTFCCLGVLCELAMMAGVPVVREQPEYGDGTNGMVRYDGYGRGLPESVLEWSGIRTPTAQFGQSDALGSLAEENDHNWASFEKIAQRIDRDFERL